MVGPGFGTAMLVYVGCVATTVMGVWLAFIFNWKFRYECALRGISVIFGLTIGYAIQAAFDWTWTTQGARAFMLAAIFQPLIVGLVRQTLGRKPFDWPINDWPFK